MEHLPMRNHPELGAGLEDVRKSEIGGRDGGGMVTGIESNGVFVESIFN